MKAILKAFRDALVADGPLTALVPAANIYAGRRDEKTNIPAVGIFAIPGGELTRYAGAAIGGMTKANEAFQISVFHREEAAAWTIADRVMSIVLGDNTTLNTAGIQNISLITMPPSLRESNMSHIPVRIRCNYHYTIT
jgi:hypothetical protein